MMWIRKIMASLLVMTMVVANVPIVDGYTVSDVPQLVDGVYELCTANHLYWFAEEVNSGNTSINGKLMADITVNTNVLTEDGKLNGDGSGFRVWTPIGTESCKYSGAFDGNGKSVSGLYFTYKSYASDYVGIFGYTYNATIDSVSLQDSYFYADEYAGGIVGKQSLGTVMNCSNSGSISGRCYIGGIVGYQDRGTVDNCTNSGSASGENDIGGITGYSYRVSNCANSGSVSGVNYVGGVVGYQPDAAVSDCTNKGSISGKKFVGGIVGQQKSGSVDDCVNSGSVSGSVSGSSEYTGGIVGSQDTGTVFNCSNSGNIQGEKFVGGIMGIQGCGMVRYCTNTGNASGARGVGGIVGVHGAGTLNNCVSSGSVSSSSHYVGGIVGYEMSGTVRNCYYVSGIVKDGSDTDQFGIGSPTQGSNIQDTSGVTTMKTADQFASGEICYLLQQVNPNAGWGQEIGVDSVPFTGGKTVYPAVDCKGESGKYSNTEGTTVHSYENGVCTLCGQLQVMLGDVDNNGKINMKDWNRLYEHLNETNPLPDVLLQAADVNNDGKVNMKDCNRLYEHLNETNPL